MNEYTTDGKEKFVPFDCPFCHMNTAGNHSYSCPANPNTKYVPVEYIKINQETNNE